MKYDGFDRQQRWVFPSRTTPGVADQADYEQYGYDPDGNRTSLRKRDGAVLLYTYDSLDRMVIKETPGNVADVRYSYDLRGLQTAAWFTSTDLGIFNAYDGFGRLTSSRSTMGGAGRTISFLYDSDGNRVRITHPDSFFTYQYDGLNRFVRVLEDGWDPLVAFAYDPAGRRSGLTRGGTASAFGYDPAGRLDSLRHDLAGTAGDQTIGLTYNPAGQILGRSGANDAFAWTGSVAADRPYSVNGQNQYTAAGPASFAYDSNGNLTSDGSTTFVYDSENRLVSASGTHVAELVYDPLGRLFQVSSGGSGRWRGFWWLGRSRPPCFEWSPYPANAGEDFLQPGLHGEPDGVGGGLHSEFLEQQGAVHLHRLFGQAEMPGDLLVALAFGHFLQDFALARREGGGEAGGALLAKGERSSRAGIDLDLRAEEPGDLAVRSEQGGDEDGVAEGRAVLPVIEDLGQRRAKVAKGLPDALGQPGLGVRPGEEAAIAADDLVLLVAGEGAEGGVGGDDRIVGQARVADHGGDRAEADRIRQRLLFHPVRRLVRH